MNRMTAKQNYPNFLRRYWFSSKLETARIAISRIQFQAVTIEFVKLPDYFLAMAHAELVGAFPYQLKRKV